MKLFNSILTQDFIILYSLVSDIFSVLCITLGTSAIAGLKTKQITSLSFVQIDKN